MSKTRPTLELPEVVVSDGLRVWTIIAAALQAPLRGALCSACVSERLCSAQVLSLRGSVRCRVNASSSVFVFESKNEFEVGNDRRNQRVSMALFAGGRQANDAIHATPECPIPNLVICW